MELNQITDKLCPECGAIAVAEERKNRHCNGQFNETRKFDCGAILKWSPNSSSLHGCTPCPNSKKEITAKRKMDSEKLKLTNFIETLNITKGLKSDLIETFSYKFR